jgi:hypothetical protein
MFRIRRNPPLTGRWLVLDRANLVLSLVVLVLALFGLFRGGELPRWWSMTIFVSVLIGVPIRQLVERHRRRLAYGSNAYGRSAYGGDRP